MSLLCDLPYKRSKQRTKPKGGGGHYIFWRSYSNRPISRLTLLITVKLQLIQKSCPTKNLKPKTLRTPTQYYKDRDIENIDISQQPTVVCSIF